MGIGDSVASSAAAGLQGVQSQILLDQQRWLTVPQSHGEASSLMSLLQCVSVGVLINMHLRWTVLARSPSFQAWTIGCNVLGLERPVLHHYVRVAGRNCTFKLCR